ncbi:CBS domain-containing protein [Ectothiorhodospiraceae bacterium WFHF3C12]|nr:CBS domain-containing protein [Ectothiorhodospiraceae bacterium WFHF3C12]
MNEDRPSSSSTTVSKSWLDRLGQAIAGGPRDREELIELLRLSHDRGLLDADALAMIEGVMHVSELQARDIMIPRSQVTVVPRTNDPWELLPTIAGSGFSRFPVTGDSRDDVIGIFIAKDLLPFLSKDNGAKEFNIRELLRPALFIPESKRLDVLLKLFQESRNHMAIVVDEYGGLAGIVTIEDVIEQIVGEIDDEHDFDEDSYILSRDGEGRTIVKALTPIEDFNEYFETEYSDDEFDTIGGVVAHQFGHVPRRNESVVVGGLRFQVIRADNRRIHLLSVTPASETATEAAAQKH